MSDKKFHFGRRDVVKLTPQGKLVAETVRFIELVCEHDIRHPAVMDQLDRLNMYIADSLRGNVSPAYVQIAAELSGSFVDLYIASVEKETGESMTAKAEAFLDEYQQAVNLFSVLDPQFPLEVTMTEGELIEKIVTFHSG